MKKIHFEWDSVKDRENQNKHGIAFAIAQYAFADPDRVIAEDISHSRAEKRYYCFGKVAEGSSEQVIGERERKFMKKKIRYTDESLGDVRIVDDFLPSPDELAFNEDQVKVTIGLSKNSVNFFKKEAKKHRTQYQKMIRRLLDIYVAHHQKRSTG
jgi:uncharacterized DUF497 family protein